MNRIYMLAFVGISLLASQAHALEKQCKQPISINQSDLPFVIKKPGTYRVCSNLCYLCNEGKPAITIDADHVVVSLDDHTIKQTTSVPNTTGIFVAANHTDIQIEAGTITNFTNPGVLVSEGVSNVILADLLVSQCGSAGAVVQTTVGLPGQVYINGGIIVLGTTSNHVTDLTVTRVRTIQNTAFSPDLPAGTPFLVAGLGLLYVDRTTVSQSDFNNNGALNTIQVHSALGVLGADVIDFKMNNSTAQANNALDVAGGVVILAQAPNPITPPPGFCRSIEVANVMASDNTSQTSNTVGITFESTLGFVCRNCTAQNHVASNLLTVSSNGGLFENCIATGAQAGPEGLGFFALESSNISYLNCLAQNNANPTNVNTAGYLAIDCQKMLYNACTAQSNGSTEAVSGGTPSGGFAFVELADSIIQNSVSQDNTGYGILLIGSTNTFVKANIITNNTVAGIADLAGGSNNVYIDNYAFNNNAGTANYLGAATPPQAPVVTWNLGTPAPATTKLDNLDIKP